MTPAIPSKIYRDAHTDQALAGLRDTRTMMSASGEPTGLMCLTISGAIAACVAAQFPAVPDLGRIVVAVSTQIVSMGTALRNEGWSADLETLSALIGLAGEQLDRESSAATG